MSYPAESYESYMVPPLFAPWASHLVQAANPQPGERVLDVACGTGIVARHVAQRVGSNGIVVGLDLNPNGPPSHSLPAWLVSCQENLPSVKQHFVCFKNSWQRFLASR